MNMARRMEREKDRLRQGEKKKKKDEETTKEQNLRQSNRNTEIRHG